MELSKQEIELFLLLPDLWWKNLFYKMFLIFTNEFKINFLNRKWNYPNRKLNYFSYFQTSNQKLLFPNVSHLIKRVQNQFSKQEMDLFKQEMGLFLPLAGLWSKTFFQKKILISTKEFKIDFLNRKWNYPNENGVMQTRNGIISPPYWPLTTTTLI